MVEDKRCKLLAFLANVVERCRDLDHEHGVALLHGSRIPKPPAKFWVYKSIEDKSQKNKDLLTKGKYGGECLRIVELKVQH